MKLPIHMTLPNPRCFRITAGLVILFSERILLKEVDYSLLLTFIGFFVFVGNLGEIEHVRLALQRLLQGRVFLTSLVASQIISNVPATFLLSQFTKNSRDLLLGVNAGGCGTLIASMTSVISFTCYAHYKPFEAGKFLFVFSWVNILFVALFLLPLVVWYGTSLQNWQEASSASGQTKIPDR